MPPGPAGVDAPIAQGFAARVVGVIFSPSRAYAGIAAAPRVLGVLLLVIAVNAGIATWFGYTERGQDIMLDQIVGTMEAFSRGQPIPDQIYQGIEDGIRNPKPIRGIAFQMVLWPVVVAITAAILMGVFNGLLGYDASFKQIAAVVAYSCVIVTLSALVLYPIAYARGTLASPTTFAAFAPFLEDGSFVARFLGTFDVFRLWGIANLAIGLGVLYKKRTGGILTGFLVVYVCIALVIAGVGALFFAA